MEQTSYIVLDTETTGLSCASGDEILQLAIISDSADLLFNEYFRPERQVTWDAAQRIHHISPAMVQDSQPFSHYRSVIQRIIDQASLLVCYNAEFDLGFLRAQGIQLRGKRFCCVMKRFASLCERQSSIRSSRHFRRSRSWSTLKACASYLGYDLKQEHDALADAKATLYCYRRLRSIEGGVSPC
jgi:DNA polymerase-3 subunit epsilon